VTPGEALAFGLVLSALSVFTLCVVSNWLAAVLLAFTIFFYAVIYTMWLKRSTPQNIVIGGLSGAMPPLLGWTAVTGTVEDGGLLLVLIIFAWTPPHFWPLAIHRKNDYAKTDIPMLPITHGDAITKLHTLLYTIIMVVVSIFPFLVDMSGLFYLVSALVLGAGFLYHSINLMVTKRPQAAMQTFRFSIFYLIALFIVLLIDHYL
jgi:protoheme IX farnesyltransferase